MCWSICRDPTQSEAQAIITEHAELQAKLAGQADKAEKARVVSEKCMKVCLIILAAAIVIIGLLTALDKIDKFTGCMCVVGLSSPIVIAVPFTICKRTPIIIPEKIRKIAAGTE